MVAGQGNPANPNGEMTIMTKPTRLILAVAISLATIIPAYAAGEQEFGAGIDAASDYRYSEALGYFRNAAKLGNLDAQRSAGLMLLYGGALYGQEIRANRGEALQWLGLAAKGGCRVSAYVLARLDAQKGVPPAMTTAFMPSNLELDP